jgi:4,5-dihydroxyphthalate decarboxylase
MEVQMSSIQISLASPPNALMDPVLEGKVTVEGVDLHSLVVQPEEMADLFLRQIRNAEFDASVFSFSSLLTLISQGRSDYVALPVYPARAFSHTNLLFRRGSSIRQDHPEDLAGARVGLLEYHMTAAVWARGALQAEFGVSAGDIQWYLPPPPSSSREAAGFSTPPSVSVRHISRSQDLVTMLRSGELDALLPYRGVDVPSLKEADYLFKDRVAEGERYLSDTSIYPINHVVVLRSSLAARHPWLAPSLVRAFQSASALDGATMAVTHGPVPYGIKENLSTLNSFFKYMFKQGLATRLLDLTDVFPTAVQD